MAKRPEVILEVEYELLARDEDKAKRLIEELKAKNKDIDEKRESKSQYKNKSHRNK